MEGTKKGYVKGLFGENKDLWVPRRATFAWLEEGHNPEDGTHKKKKSAVKMVERKKKGAMSKNLSMSTSSCKKFGNSGRKLGPRL